jgi:HSP20 family protein
MPYDAMLDNFFSSQRPLFSLSKRVWNPPTDICECEAGTEIKIEVAGLDEKNLQILVDRNLLIVRGRRVQESDGRKLNYHLMEIHYGQFERVFAFSYNLSEDAISATYEKGFLLIRVTKQAPHVTSVTVRVVRDDAPEP